MTGSLERRSAILEELEAALAAGDLGDGGDIVVALSDWLRGRPL